MELLPTLFEGVDVLLLTPGCRSYLSVRFQEAVERGWTGYGWADALMTSDFRRTEPPVHVNKKFELDLEYTMCDMETDSALFINFSEHVQCTTGFISILWCFKDDDERFNLNLITNPSFLKNDLFVKCVLQNERGEDLVCVSGHFDAHWSTRSFTLNGTEFHRTAKRAIESGENKLQLRANLTYAFFKSITSAENIGKKSAQPSTNKAHAIGA